MKNFSPVIARSESDVAIHRQLLRRDGLPRWARNDVLALVLILFATPALAATQSDAEATMKAAQAEETQAKADQAAWTTTETTLAEAEKSIAAQKWDEAKALADEALALAKRSREQATEQKTLWQNAVIR